MRLIELIFGKSVARPQRQERRDRSKEDIKRVDNCVGALKDSVAKSKKAFENTINARSKEADANQEMRDIIDEVMHRIDRKQ